MYKIIFLQLFLLAQMLKLNAQNEGVISDSILNHFGEQTFENAVKAFTNDLDSTLIYLDESLFYFQKTENWPKIIRNNIAKISVYNSQGDYEQFDSMQHIVLDLANEHLEKNDATFAAVWNMYAMRSKKVGNYNRAINYFRQSLAINLENEINNDIASLYNNIGNTFLLKGDYEEALKNFQEARQYQLAAVGTSWRSALTTINIGNTYRKLNKFENAKSSYEEAIHFFIKKENKIKKTSFKKQLTKAYFNLAEMALENKDWKKLKLYIQKAEHFRQRVYVTDLGRSDEILGEMYLQQGKINKALFHFEKSYTLAKEEFKAFKKYPEIANKLLNLAKVYQARKATKEAINYYHQALEMVSNANVKVDSHQNPNPDSIYSKLIALDALKGKADCLYQSYQQTDQLEDLAYAYRTYQLSIKLIPAIRQDLRRVESKELLSPKVLPLFESAIQLSLELYSLTNDEKYLHHSFNYAERNKATLLLESIHEVDAKKIAGIPDSLLEQGKSLSLEISYFKELINEEKQIISKKDVGKIDRLERKLFQLDNDYRILVENLEKKYPKYNRFKNNDNISSVKEVQKYLGTNSKLLIEYFVGENNIYVFAITNNDFKVRQLAKKNSFDDDLSTIRQLISQAPNVQDIDLGYQKYMSLAHQLYQELVAPSLNENVESLVIVPDDILSLLPFEVLLMKRPSNSSTTYHLEDMHYLVEQFDISYGYSTTLLLDNHNKNKQSTNENSFVGFAPSFREVDEFATTRTCQADEIYSLQCSQDEVTRIQEIWNGKTFVGKAANIKSFKENAPQSGIIHLATHACVDDNDHQFNRIYFSDDHLSNNDFYNFLFSSKLAVLSACNTGSGRLVKGEGVMSLSRGFIQAGCPSVVMSLWSVDDCTTSDIMASFYKYLKEGHSKDKALRNAKISFLNSSKKAYQHPFYWATFVQIGNADSLLQESTPLKKILFIGVLAFVVLSLLLKKFGMLK